MAFLQITDGITSGVESAIRDTSIGEETFNRSRRKLRGGIHINLTLVSEEASGRDSCKLVIGFGGSFGEGFM